MQDDGEDYVSEPSTVGFDAPTASQIYAGITEADVQGETFGDGTVAVHDRTSFVLAGTAIESFTFDITDTSKEYDQDESIALKVVASGFERAALECD